MTSPASPQVRAVPAGGQRDGVDGVADLRLFRGNGEPADGGAAALGQPHHGHDGRPGSGHGDADEEVAESTPVSEGLAHHFTDSVAVRLWTLHLSAHGMSFLIGCHCSF